MAAVTRFAANPEAISGRLSARVDVAGRGAAPDAILKTLGGTARIDIRDGSIKNLGLVRSVVLAGSMRADSRAQLDTATADEPFSRLTATLTLADGSAASEDLRFESRNLLLTGTGSFRTDGSAVHIVSRVQLSDELSKQAGRDLVRYTQRDGRVTLPATVTGSLGAFSVRIDAAEVAKRAITNRATEEARKAIRKGLGGLLK
jgi:AsmA protein